MLFCESSVPFRRVKYIETGETEIIELGLQVERTFMWRYSRWPGQVQYSEHINGISILMWPSKDDKKL